MSQYQQTYVEKRQTEEVPYVANSVPGEVRTQSGYVDTENKDNRGIIDKIKDTFTGSDHSDGGNPAKNAQKYAEKASCEAKREAKLEEEAQKYADKAAAKAAKFSQKAEEKLAEKDRAYGKVEEYSSKAQAEAAKARQCNTSNFDRQAEQIHCAGSKLEQCQ